MAQAKTSENEAFDDRLARVNAELKAGTVKLSIKRRNNSLYLRGTLPPKPDSDKKEPHQQEIALGVYANPGGLKRAKIEALSVASKIGMKEFCWDDYLKARPKQELVADWVIAFEKNYFEERSRTPKTQTTWDKDYAISFRKLNQRAVLTSELLLTAIALTAPDTRTRQRVCMVFGALARFAGIELDLKKLRGSYSPASVQIRDLPTDDEIERWRESIVNPKWRWLYGVIAAYGLRNHEAFLLDVESLAKAPGALIVLGGKTGARTVYPYRGEWWRDWDLGGTNVPDCTGKDHSSLGLRVTQFFKRHGIPFTPYDLRHAWAARTAVAGLDASIAAKMMGHSLTIHHQTYHQFLSDSHLRAAWESTQKPNAPL